MKTKRNPLLNKCKKPNKFKYRNLLIGLLLCLFPLNCTFKDSLVYNKFLMYISFSHKNLNFELENINSTRKTLLPKSEIDLNILSYNLFYIQKKIYILDIGKK
ncbi:hypothetical protein AMR47_02875 [Leptospira interrogans]|nr:hypothetical protein AMR47_02875 [Leptospira interrogans]